jgi:hypothetical protein
VLEAVSMAEGLTAGTIQFAATSVKVAPEPESNSPDQLLDRFNAEFVGTLCGISPPTRSRGWLCGCPALSGVRVVIECAWVGV